MEGTSEERILVTGGAGFVGSNLVRRLVGEGRQVHVLVRPGRSTWRLADVKSQLQCWEGDITNRASLLRTVAGSQPTIIFHLAADTTTRRWSGDFRALDLAIDVNLKGTLNLLRSVQETGVQVRRIVRAGSLFEYGFGPVPFHEEQRERPVSPYSASQVAAELFLDVAIRSGVHFPYVTLRFGWVYGPYGPLDFFVASLIDHCLGGKEFAMTAGAQIRDLVYVGDVVDACLLAGHAELCPGEIINIGGGHVRPIREVAEAIARKCGTPELLQAGVLQDRVGDAGDAYCDNSKALTLLRWRPATCLDEGLDRTIAWYRNHRKLLESAEG